MFSEKNAPKILQLIMNTTRPLKLYTTSHCHLCELALELVLQQCSAEQLMLIEIADDDCLLKSYGTRIPVLQRTDTLALLCWPFNGTDIQQFLSA